MKLGVVLVLALVPLFLRAHAESKAIRERHVISAGWRFQIDAADIGQRDGWYKTEYDRSAWREVTMPRAWDLYETALWGYEGVGWYAAVIPAHSARTDCIQRLYFERVNYHTTVWLNGQMLGENCDGWMPFEFDVSGLLKPDQVNHLVLRVDNRPRPDWLPGATRIEWVQYGGLLGPVYLENHSRTYIADVTVRATSPTIQCLIRVGTRVAAPLTICAKVSGTESTTNLLVRPDQTSTVALPLTLSEAKWWSPNAPHLYELDVELRANGTLIDRVTQRFGLRRLEVKDRQIVLNGSPIHIRGVNRYDEYAPYGPNPPRELVLEDLRAMRRAGINTVRVHYPQSPELIDLYDEMGFMLIEELPINWWQLHPRGADGPVNDITSVARATLERMIQRDKNHPCIIIWSMANESPTHTPTGIQTMQALIRRTRELDKTRLVSFVASHGDLTQHRAFAEADLVCANIYAGTLHPPIAQRRAEIEDKVYRATADHLREATSQFPNKPFLITEFGTRGISGLRGDALYTEDFQAECIHAALRAIRETTTVAGCILWCWADYYHRRDFIEYAAYGPYGVVTVDRKPKLALTVLTEMFNKE
jgi:beta-galactosidase/beta-glucuronidase